MWWEAGWHKFVDPKWMDTGEALLNYWQRGLKMTPKPAIAFDWYRAFIEFLVNSEAHTWFSKIIIFGELAIALGLILGAFVGITAFFGA
jgi:thiosulfate dehydrogenase [quinone] large subunit